jgi:formamidopyrimidine-DNA glycosylase
MPELPEVETVCRGLVPVMQGRTFQRVVLNRRDLRFPLPDDFEARLAGARVVDLYRRAKYMLAHLSSGDALLMHLGMTGRFIIHRHGASAAPGNFHHGTEADAAPAAVRHVHVVFEMDGGDIIEYADPRRFGIMDLVAQSQLLEHKLMRGLGVEPLGNELSGPYLNEAFRGKRAPLKAVLLDQRLIAGIGNIYASEALYRAGLSPRRLAGTITAAAGTTRRVENLAAAVRAVLRDAIEAGGSTLRDYVSADGELGYFQHSFDVYDRDGEPCRRDGCGGVIRRIVQSGRSTYFCPTCQR